MMTPFAKGIAKGEHVQARVSQAQYINTWVSALEGVKNIPTRNLESWQI